MAMLRLCGIAFLSPRVWSGGGRRANGHDMKEEEEETEEKGATKEKERGWKRKERKESAREKKETVKGEDAKAGRGGEDEGRTDE